MRSTTDNTNNKGPVREKKETNHRLHKEQPQTICKSKQTNAKPAAGSNAKRGARKRARTTTTQAKSVPSGEASAPSGDTSRKIVDFLEWVEGLDASGEEAAAKMMEAKEMAVGLLQEIRAKAGESVTRSSSNVNKYSWLGEDEC
mmetsp:Transcript_20287/g.36127  ORF Transcript_20287/g.36127 Transcript_20287/m.36127 type:complete len:144 (+) Transcript_20287:124-555(+)|eukprot:CAMPEP_0197543944 /NCGR_PEP_ID=MMETSP1318-20131121/68509_1 /TAXON_ID=552666 /ORGANISM="Partenskyella glossopodia, Strain RCC365" /LENGTH=143 /DNA_ID=CAMNT_0043103313 /DNA_START=463 /DNA_END=894 /DNA_ORIENTATION=-